MRLGQITGGDQDAVVTGFAIDHRKVAPGTIFGAFQGARVNGEDYIPAAVAAGAIAVVARREAVVEGALHIVADDPRAAFAQAGSPMLAVAAMLVFGLFTHMACGATYALVPFIDRKALGGVAGIIGAGGNVGALAAGFLMKGVGDTAQTLYLLGIVVTVSALCALAVRFGPQHNDLPLTPDSRIPA